ncbi:hypothetical protein F5Y17DRAFT_445857 [Xylariaceae sp. FL0594]|nr:hypothetical protein F5Y17DRAFT_445857 [Xylariaceae sp. FL0594]
MVMFLSPCLVFSTFDTLSIGDGEQIPGPTYQKLSIMQQEKAQLSFEKLSNNSSRFSIFLVFFSHPPEYLRLLLCQCPGFDTSAPLTLDCPPLFPPTVSFFSPSTLPDDY